MLDLAHRAALTETVVARFRGRPFDWKKRRTCIHLARAQARALGHRPPPIPDFRSPKSARAALRSTGYETLEALLDSLFVRIPPAGMWIGDIVLGAGGDGLGAIGIAVGGKIIGYHQDHLAEGLVNIEIEAADAFVGAWRL